MFYRMNDGIAYIYDVLPGKGNKSEGKKPLRPIEGNGKSYFEYIGIKTEDYTVAHQNDVQIESRIRILQNRKISTKNVIKINDLYYKVWRVRHSVNKNNVPITDITLVVNIENYEVVI